MVKLCLAQLDTHAMVKNHFLILLASVSTWKYMGFLLFLLSLKTIAVSFTMSLFSFCFHDLSIGKDRVLKSPNIIVQGAMCVLSISNVSFTNMDALALGA